MSPNSCGSFDAVRSRIPRGLLATVLSIPIAAAALSGPPSLAGEELTIREGILDEATLKTVRAPEGVGVIVRPFPTDKADLGTAEKGDHEKRLDAVNIMKREAPRALSEQIVKSLTLGGTYAYAREEAESDPPADSIVIEGRFTRIDPGSRAKRWAIFAGQSGVEVEGTVKNAQGEILAEFRHQRRSGAGLAGGDYVKFLMDDTRDVGSDIALFLKRWAQGGDLHEE